MPIFLQIGQLYYRPLKKISRFQFEYFKHMIPNVFLELWEKGLKTEEYYLKVCGAGGGGGYILVFSSSDVLKLNQFLKYKVITLL